MRNISPCVMLGRCAVVEAGRRTMIGTASLPEDVA